MMATMMVAHLDAVLRARPLSRLVSFLLPAILLVSLASPALAAELHEPPAGMGLYLMVLREPGTPPPAGAPSRTAIHAEAEPDVAALGGPVLEARSNRRLIQWPLAAVRELRAHASVLYLQSIGSTASIDSESPTPESHLSNVAADKSIQARMMLAENCATGVRNAFAAGGVGTNTPGQRAATSLFGTERPFTLQNNLERGPLSVFVGQRVVFAPGKPPSQPQQVPGQPAKIDEPKLCVFCSIQ